MNKRMITSLFVSIFCILTVFGNPLLSGGEDVGQEQARVEYRLVVKVIDNEWRVVFEDDNSRSDVTLRRGDRIRWTVEGSDVSFQFPDSRIFGEGIKVVKAGTPMVLAISANSPGGTFPYAVFVHQAMTYARGQSPPRIIVRDE